MMASGHLGLAAGDLLERPTDVQRWRRSASLGLPWHWAAQCPVHLEDARSVLEATHRFAIARGQSLVRKLEQLTGRDVEQLHLRLRKLIKVADPVARVQLAPSGF